MSTLTIPSSVRLCLRHAATAALLAIALLAQRPSAFVDLMPPGGVNLANLQAPATGKLALYRSGQYLRVFSTVTGSWHAHTPSFGTTPILTDELLLVPESDRYTAISARRGVFEVHLVNVANSTLVTGPTIACVRQGNNAAVFSAFTGRWHTHSVAANLLGEVGDRLAVFSDLLSYPNSFTGITIFDALDGSWHDLPPQPANSVRASISGSTALYLFRHANGFGFEATYTHQQGWQFAQVPTIPPLNSLGGGGLGGSEFVSIFDLSFSGVTGALTSLGRALSPRTTGLVPTPYDTVNPQTWCLGITGTSWVQLPTGSYDVDGGIYAEPAGVRLHANGNQTLAFNGLDNTFANVANAPAVFPSRVSFHNGAIVAAVAEAATGRVDVYSAVTGLWHPLPANALPEPIGFYGPQPIGTASAVILATSNGVVAFSGRTGAFVSLPGSNLTRRGGAVVTDAANLHVFDARTDRWLTRPLSSAATLTQSGDIVLAVDGQQVTGFGARAARFDSVTAPESIVQSFVLAGGAVVVTANHVYGYASLPEVLPHDGFPDDYHVCAPGMTLRQQVRVPAGGVALLALAPRAPSPVSLPPYGELWLDANAMLLQLLVPAAGEQRVELAWPLPNLPGLHRTEWFEQALVLPPTGQAWMTAASSVFLL